MDPFPGADAQGAQGHLQQALRLDGRGHQPVIALEHQGKQRRQRREKLEKQRRQRQEELGKTNRFTPVRAAQRKAEKPKGEKDG